MKENNFFTHFINNYRLGDTVVKKCKLDGCKKNCTVRECLKACEHDYRECKNIIEVERK